MSRPSPRGERGGKIQSYRVIAYSGYQGEQEPRWLLVDCERLALEIRRRWLEPGARCFEAVAEGCVYRLRCRLPELEWTVEQQEGTGLKP